MQVTGCVQNSLSLTPGMPWAGPETKTGKSSVLQEAPGAKLRSQVTWQSLLPQSLGLEEQSAHWRSETELILHQVQ